MSPLQYRRVTGFALAALTLIVITGASVRLTESGLGCSDWPTCEQDQLVADLEIHAMVEFVNRVITGLVSLAVIATAFGSLVLRPRRRDLITSSLGLVAGLIGQIVLGGLVVLSHLNPWLVLPHFLLSMVLVAIAVVLHSRAGDDPPITVRTGRWYRWPMTGLTALAISIGTLVTGAGPHSGSRDAQPIERLNLHVPTITRIHGAVVVALAMMVASCIAYLRRAQAPDYEQRRARMIMVTLLAQASIGYIQYFSGVPVVLVGFHVAGATALWILVLWFHLDRPPKPSDHQVNEVASKFDALAADDSIMVL